MSFQRAAINCGACYRLMKYSTFDCKAEEVQIESVFATTPGALDARNEAMKALESMITPNPSCKNASDQNYVANQMLDACYGCNFAKPLICRMYVSVREAENDKS